MRLPGEPSGTARPSSSTTSTWTRSSNTCMPVWCSQSLASMPVSVLAYPSNGTEPQAATMRSRMPAVRTSLVAETTLGEMCSRPARCSSASIATTEA